MTESTNKSMLTGRATSDDVEAAAVVAVTVTLVPAAGVPEASDAAEAANCSNTKYKTC